MENCEHRWKHKVEEDKNLRGDKCLFLYHICQNCGESTDGILLEVIEKVEKDDRLEEDK